MLYGVIFIVVVSEKVAIELDKIVDFRFEDYALHPRYGLLNFFKTWEMIDPPLSPTFLRVRFVKFLDFRLDL
jgi:hypothetical protein